MPYRSSITLIAALGFFVFLFLISVFPGRQTPLALTLATGWNVDTVQQKIDGLEEKAILNGEFTEADRTFLADLYSVGAKGGRITGYVPVGSKLVTRYLSGTGEDFEIDASFVRRSRPVQDQIKAMRDFLVWRHSQGRSLDREYSSDVFYMGDPTEFDLVTSLYFGKLHVEPTADQRGTLKLNWRVEMPWVWPTYEELYAQYGDYHAQNFALPNLRSLFSGRRHMIKVDDGLGGHLPALGLAKPFRVYAQWSDYIKTPHAQR